MNYISDSQPPLPDWILDAYHVVRMHERSEDHKSVSWDCALDILRRNDSLVLEPEDAHYALKRLVERGYLYEVNNKLCVTIPEENINTSTD